MWVGLEEKIGMAIKIKVATIAKEKLPQLQIRIVLNLERHAL